MARVIALATALFLCTLAPRLAAAASPGAVAVLSLDEGTTEAEQEVARNLLDAGLDVFVAEDLARRLAQHQVASPEAAVASRFSSMTTTIAAGVESFFYRGNEAAIETISPMFDLGIAHPEVLARRPDFADQIFSAGVILVRAHQNLGNEENTRAVARLLVKRFPSKKASATTVPPKVIKLLDAERANVAKSGSSILLRPITTAGSECTTYLNGAPAEAETPYVVGANEDHYVWIDCGAVAGPLWKTRSLDGAQLDVPVLIEDPLAIRLDPSDFSQRREVERRLEALTFWADVATIVGVSRGPASSEEALVLVRIESDGRTQWSDGATAESVQRAFVRVFPELAGSVKEPALAETTSLVAPPPDVLAWSLLGGAAVAAGAGTFLLLTAAQRTRLLACAAQGGGSASDCEGVEVLQFTDTEFERDLQAVRTRRALGVGTVGLALGLAGWGIVRLATPSPTVSIAVSGRGLAVRMQF